MKHKILITGAGKIGALIACLLGQQRNYEVHIADLHFTGVDISYLLEKKRRIKAVQLDVTDHQQMITYIKENKIQAIVSCLPFYVNIDVAEIASTCQLHYFDLTEDTHVTERIRQLAQNTEQVFMPQCGLAPGFISIVAHHLLQHFDRIDTVKLRVGALPQHVHNALYYSLTWSTDGLINQYANLCDAVVDGQRVVLQPLGGLEAIKLDGLTYEAFNTSGGLGSLADSYSGKVKHLSYKTLRYPGHCDIIRILMEDLKLKDDRDTLKRILENSVPKTYQDVVVTYVSVNGYQNNEYVEENYQNKFYPQLIADRKWSAIQATTAASMCSVVDIVLNNLDKYRGMVLQEHIDLDEFLANRFAQYYR